MEITFDSHIFSLALQIHENTYTSGEIRPHNVHSNHVINNKFIFYNYYCLLMLAE